MSTIMKMAGNKIEEKMLERSLDINWQEYNYPYGLKIIHFRPSELEDPFKIKLAQVRI